MSFGALAQSTTLRVENRTSSYLNVTVDGGYGCHTAAGTTCSIPVTVGNHQLTAVRTDTGESLNDTVYVPIEGGTWTIVEN